MRIFHPTPAIEPRCPTPGSSTAHGGRLPSESPASDGSSPQAQLPLVELRLRYGFGATCAGRLRRDQLTGQTARQALLLAVTQAQADAPTRHIARIVQEILSSQRPLDAEFYRAGDDLEQPGTPLALDQPLPVRLNGDAEPVGESLTVLISETYRGGGGREE